MLLLAAGSTAASSYVLPGNQPLIASDNPTEHRFVGPPIYVEANGVLPAFSLAEDESQEFIFDITQSLNTDVFMQARSGSGKLGYSVDAFENQPPFVFPPTDVSALAGQWGWRNKLQSRRYHLVFEGGPGGATNVEVELTHSIH
jgi:hypothetical protein